MERMFQIVQIYSNDIGMLTLKQEKKPDCRGIELPKGEWMGDLDDDGYKYLEILEPDKILHREMKDKVTTAYLGTSNFS